MRKILLLFLLFPLYIHAQDFTGDWKGSFTSTDSRTRIFLLVHIVKDRGVLAGKIRFTWPDGRYILYVADMGRDRSDTALLNIRIKKAFDSTDLPDAARTVCSEMEMKGLTINNSLDGITLNLAWANAGGNGAALAGYTDPKQVTTATILLWRMQSRLEARSAYVAVHTMKWKEQLKYEEADANTKVALDDALGKLVVPAFVRDFYDQTFDPARDKIGYDSGVCTLQLEGMLPYYVVINEGRAQCLVENYFSDRSVKVFGALENPAGPGFEVKDISVTLDCGNGSATYKLTKENPKTAK